MRCLGLATPAVYSPCRTDDLSDTADVRSPPPPAPNSVPARSPSSPRSAVTPIFDPTSSIFWPNPSVKVRYPYDVSAPVARRRGCHGCLVCISSSNARAMYSSTLSGWYPFQTRRNRLVITPNRKQLPGWTAAACCHEGSPKARSANSQNRTSVTVSGSDGHDGTLPQLLLLPTLWGCADRLSGLSTYPKVTVPGQRQSTCSRPSWPGRRGHARPNTRPDSRDCTPETAPGRVARMVARPGATTPAR